MALDIAANHRVCVLELKISFSTSENTINYEKKATQINPRIIIEQMKLKRRELNQG
jgi:hypothetical protein